MRIDLPLPRLIEVRNVTNYKGNPRSVLLADGEQVLYRDGHVEDEEAAADAFRYAFTRMLRHWLLEVETWAGDDGWSGRTDREIDHEQHDTVRLEGAP